MNTETTRPSPMLQNLQSLHQKRRAEETVTPRPQRSTNGELLEASRNAPSERARSVAAEALRRQVRSLCAAALARSSSRLTAQELDDLVQDVFLRLLQSPPGTDPSPAYVHRIATNLLIDQHRHLARRGQDQPVQSLDEGDSEAERTAAAPGPGIEESVIAALEARALRELLARTLKPTEAQILMRRSEGAAHDEIAQELGLSCANVRKQWERGVKRLRERMPAYAF